MLSLQQGGAFITQNLRCGTISKVISHEKYEKWKVNQTEISGQDIFLIGAGGISYPICFLETLKKYPQYMDIAATGDDIWFHFVAQQHDFLNRKIVYEAIAPVRLASQITALKHANLHSKNDEMLKQCREFFKLD